MQIQILKAMKLKSLEKMNKTTMKGDREKYYGFQIDWFQTFQIINPFNTLLFNTIQQKMKEIMENGE